MHNDVKQLKYLVEKYGKSDILNAINELEISYDFWPFVSYNTQSKFIKWFYRELAKDGKTPLSDDMFYFDDVNCIDTETGRDIPGVKCDGILTANKMYDKLVDYFNL